MAKNKIYITEFDADGKAYLNKLDMMQSKTDSATAKMQKSVMRVNDAYLKMAGVVAALGGVTAFIKDSIAAYTEEEKIVKRLDTALGRHNKTLQTYAAHLQKITTYADDQVLSAMALISNYVKEENTIKKLTKATMDLATAKDMDLSVAAELVAKTVGSSTNALKRQGIEFDNNLKGIERVNAVLEALNLFQGQAEAQADTYSGKLQILNNQFNDMQEAVGAGVIPTLTEFGTVLTNLTNQIDSSGISGLLDKWLKLVLIVPRVGLKGLGAISGLFSGGVNPSDYIMSASKYTQGFITQSNSYNNWLLGMPSDPVLGGGGKGGKGGASSPLNRTGRRYATEYGAGFLEATGTGKESRLSREMTEVMVPELNMAFADIGMSFVDKFSETQNIAGNIANIFGATSDSFLGQMMQVFDYANSFFSILGSISSIAGGGLFGLLGLAEGGTVINKGGKLSYAPIPKFARGGSFTVPPGYANDSGLIRVQSGERVDVTPTNQVPMVAKAFQELKNVMMAGNMNSGRKGKQPIVVNVMLDGYDVSKRVTRNQNRLDKRGVNLGEL